MATKTFPYAVIWGGEIIPPNTPIQVKETVVAKNATTTTEKPNKKAVKKNDESAD